MTRSEIECSTIFTSMQPETKTSQITRLIYCYPIKLICPRQSERSSVCFQLSYGGGMVSGDSVDLEVSVQEDAHLLLMTLTATKVYKRSQIDDKSGEYSAFYIRPNAASQKLHVHVKARALFCLLPDPIIPFKNSSYVQLQDFYLHSGNGKWEDMASCFLLDWFSCGRYSRGERWLFDRYASSNQLFLDGHGLFLRDAFVLDASDAASTAQKFGVVNALANVVLVGPKVETISSSIMEKQLRMQSEHRQGHSDIVIWSASLIDMPLHFPQFDDGRVSIGVLVRIAAAEVFQVRQFINTFLMDGLSEFIDIGYFTRKS
eukprot:Partr_v1_DN28610_c3_g1_i1_m50305 putative urease accessory protein